MLGIFHHWWLPVASGIIWWGMLIALLACWAAQGHPVYAWMNAGDRTILYISDIAASDLQPIFISCAGAQGLLFVLALASERWLRHRQRLRPNVRKADKWLSIWGIGFAIIGQLGILFVSIFNTRHYHDAHESLLVIFIVFIGVSSLASIGEYYFLDKQYQRKRHIIVSLYGKTAWFLVELAVAIGFVSCHNSHPNASAVLEWCISFIYPFYSLLLAWDLWPAYNKSKGHYPRYNDYSSYPSGFDPTDAEAAMVAPIEPMSPVNLVETHQMEKDF